MPKGNYDVEIPVFVRIAVNAKTPNKKKAYKEAIERIRAVFNTLPPGMHYRDLTEDEYAIVYIDGVEYDK
jgi:hypothetical protein